MSTRTLTKARLGRCRNCGASIPRDDMGLSLCDDCLQEMAAAEAPRPATYSRAIQGRKYTAWRVTDQCWCIRRDRPGGRTAQFRSRDDLERFCTALGKHLADLDKRQAARRESARQAAAVQAPAPKPEPDGWHGWELLCDLKAQIAATRKTEAETADYWQRWQLATPYHHEMLWWNGVVHEANRRLYALDPAKWLRITPRHWQEYTEAHIKRAVAVQLEAHYQGWAEAIKRGDAGRPRVDFGALGAGL